MAFTGSMEDRLKIRERIGAYSDAIFRADLEDYLACWTEDGVRSGAGGDCRGKPELREHWAGIWRYLDRMGFFSEVAAIEVDGAHATARSYCQEILQLKNGDLRRLVGTYNDELVLDNGDWLFARRTYEVLFGEGAVSKA